MNNRELGKIYEDKAAGYLENCGFNILCRNFNCRIGEIDIIAYKNDTLHFVEVKYRKNSFNGYAAEAVDANKRRKICKSAVVYMKYKGYGLDRAVSFDVIEMYGNGTINYIENAFEYC